MEERGTRREAAHVPSLHVLSRERIKVQLHIRRRRAHVLHDEGRLPTIVAAKHFRNVRQVDGRAPDRSGGLLQR